jgi:hypothetical protein
MSTTSLFVEVLVAGALAEVWMLLLFLKMLPSTANLANISSAVSDFSLLLVVPFIALTYALGWAVNFAAEKLFESVWERKYKYPKYEGAKLPKYATEMFETQHLTPQKRYEIISGFFFQYASNTVVEDLRFGVHIIRISRSSALNFALIAASLLLYLPSYPSLTLIGMAIAVLVAILVYFQGTTRFNRTHKRTRNTYDELIAKFDHGFSEAKNSVLSANALETPVK